jgi:hypothetical protein
MVAAVMRTRFDQFGKQMVREAVAGHCFVESDAEVTVETRRIDLWVTPREASPSLPDHLGLLGRINGGSATLEFFHNTPTGEELHVCLRKHGEFRHALSRRRTRSPLPLQWVISSGRPDAGIAGLGFRPMIDAPRGIYDSPPLQHTRLVVVSELPATRDTLLVRLLGAGSVLKQAITELQSLPADEPERRLALPALLRLRLAVPTDPAQQTKEDQEFLMDTQDVVEAWLQEAIQKGVKQGVEQGVKQGLQQGIQQGERKLLLLQLRQRFGAEVDADIEHRIAMAPAEQIELWGARLLSAGTLAELLAD